MTNTNVTHHSDSPGRVRFSEDSKSYDGTSRVQCQLQQHHSLRFDLSCDESSVEVGSVANASHTATTNLLTMTTVTNASMATSGSGETEKVTAVVVK